MSFHNRSDALIDLLEELTQQGHQTSSSAAKLCQRAPLTDLDIVVAPDTKAELVEFLERGDLRKQTVTPRNGSYWRIYSLQLA